MIMTEIASLVDKQVTVVDKWCTHMCLVSGFKFILMSFKMSFSFFNVKWSPGFLVWSSKLFTNNQSTYYQQVCQVTACNQRRPEIPNQETEGLFHTEQGKA